MTIIISKTEILFGTNPVLCILVYYSYRTVVCLSLDDAEYNTG